LSAAARCPLPASARICPAVAAARRRSHRAAPIARPVASPPEWKMRRWEWAPSIPRDQAPAGSVSNSTPASARETIASPPASQSARTAGSSQWPAPAARVSATWEVPVSSVPMTPAIPPCAQAVFDSPRPPWVPRVMAWRPARCSAAVSAAVPEATTMAGPAGSDPRLRGEHSCQRLAGGIGHRVVDRDLIDGLTVDERLEHPGDVAGVDPVHRRTRADDGIEAEDRVLRMLGGQPLDEVDLRADGEGRRLIRLGDGLRDVCGRAGLIGGGHGLARALGVDDDADVRMFGPGL